MILTEHKIDSPLTVRTVFDTLTDVELFFIIDGR